MQTMDVLSVVSPRGRRGRKKAYTRLTFSNLPQLIVAEQVNAGEPDHPVRPATPGGFQHFISKSTVPKPGSYLCTYRAHSHVHTLRSVWKDYIIHTSAMCRTLILWQPSVSLSHMCGRAASRARSEIPSEIIVGVDVVSKFLPFHVKETRLESFGLHFFGVQEQSCTVLIIHF